MAMATGAGLLTVLPTFGERCWGCSASEASLPVSTGPKVPKESKMSTETPSLQMSLPVPTAAFFGRAAGLAAVGIAVIAGGRTASILARKAAGAVTRLLLPPASGHLGEGGPGRSGSQDQWSGPLITPNEDLYRIDTALISPAIDVGSWSLRIHGMVDDEVIITMAELLDLPLDEQYVSFI